MELLNTNSDKIYGTVADYEQAKANLKALKADLEAFEKDLIEQSGDKERDFVFPDGTLTVPEKKRTGDSPKYKAIFEAFKVFINEGQVWQLSKGAVRAWLESLWEDNRGDKYGSRKPKRKATNTNKKRAKVMAK